MSLESAASALWTVAAKSWVELSHLRRSLLTAFLVQLHSLDVFDLEEYAKTTFSWPAGLFHHVCASNDASVAAAAVVALVSQTAHLIGHHVRLPDMHNITKVVTEQIEQVEHNIQGEGERLKVLEDMLETPHEDLPLNSMTSCALDHHHLGEEVAAIANDAQIYVETICRSNGVEACSAVLDEINMHGEREHNGDQDQRIQDITQYIETQLHWSETLHGNHFMSAHDLWVRLDASAAELQSLTNRARRLFELARNLELEAPPSIGPCDDAALCADGLRDLLQKSARHARDELGQIQSRSTNVSDKRVHSKACSVLLRLAEWMEIAELDAQEMAEWQALLVRRVNAMSVAWKALMSWSVKLHAKMRSQMPDYRRRAFNEIYLNTRWGQRGSSGGGSSDLVRTNALADDIIFVIQNLHSKVVLDLGCGWGEWLPPAICRAMTNRQLPDGFRYIGWDVARDPIDGARAKATNEWTCGVDWQFRDVDGLLEALPGDVDFVVVRHVLQHLGVRDALAFLQHLRCHLPGAFVLLSTTDGSENIDLDDVFGGSSSFGLVSRTADSVLPTSKGTSMIDGYDLQRAPFNLPEPLLALRDGNASEALLLYRAESLPACSLRSTSRNVYVGGLAISLHDARS